MIIVECTYLCVHICTLKGKMEKESIFHITQEKNDLIPGLNSN